MFFPMLCLCQIQYNAVTWNGWGQHIPLAGAVEYSEAVMGILVARMLSEAWSASGALFE